MSPIDIHLTTGVTLKADYLSPSPSDSQEAKLAVCLHPWSWLGGTMNDPVLDMLLEPLQAKNYHIIRYNSRGVGGSTGWPSFTGLSEGEDLQALVSWAMRDLIRSQINAVTIIGYSYGSLVASLYPVLPGIKTSHVFISYPLGPRSWLTLFRSSTYTTKLKNLINSPESNVLVLYGDRDEFTSKQSYDKWGADLRSVSERKEFLNICCRDGASHFWRGGHGRWLRESVQHWLP